MSFPELLALFLFDGRHFCGHLCFFGFFTIAIFSNFSK
ncbi:4Fe-4S binding protein [Acinetobacter indicus]|nr:4Fe-4S binding protein [Acinetobacter indicus]